MAAAGGSLPTLPAVLQEKLDIVTRAFGEAEPRHNHYKKRWEHFYRLYRSYKEVKHQYRSAAGNRRDVDDVLQEARAGFGADLFIPYVFSVIETVVPRMLSNNPTLLVTPADPDSEDNVDTMKLVVDRQQSQTNFVLAAQDIVKQGCMYGLGLANTGWARDVRNAPVLERPMAQTNGGPAWVVGRARERVLYEGPRARAWDPFDGFWDPYGVDADTIGYFIFRTWRDERYVRQMLKGADSPWKLPKGWKLEDVLGAGSRSKYDEAWSARLAAGGLDNAQQREREIHEVWEFHDGEQVITVLDRAIPVQSGVNPNWHGEIPVSIYRPTRLPNEFVGIGEVEPLEDLQLEMNELRTGRRNNAALAMQRPIAYMDGMLTPSQVQFAPGMMWPVDGDPNQLLKMIEVPDVPFSSYREDDALKADIERVSGIDDSSTGVGGADQTATGVQLVQAAANIRIKNKSMLFEKECARRVCEQWVSLDQQRIVSEVTIAGPPKPDEGDRQFSWYSIGPAELAGTFAIEPDAGSMSPQNEIAKKQAAQQFLQTFMIPGVTDPRAIVLHALQEWDVRGPETFLLPQTPQIPPEVVDRIGEILIQEGRVAADEFQALVQEAEQEYEQAKAAAQAGPTEIPPGGGPGPGSPAPQQQGPPQGASQQGAPAGPEAAAAPAG
jgi:hypothetical protein